MSLWGAIGLGLGAVIVAGAARTRRRLQALLVLPRESAVHDLLDDAYILWTAPGVSLSPEVAAAARRLAREEGLEALELLPRDWPALRALAFAQVVDFTTFRHARLARGFSDGQAILVHSVLAARCGLGPPASREALRAAMVQLKRYSPEGVDYALADMAASGLDGAARWGRYRELFFRATPTVLAGQLLLWLLVLHCASHGGLLGLAPFVAMCLEPLVALAGTALQPPDLGRAALFALPWQLWEWLDVVAAGWRAVPDPAVDALRSSYDAELARGLDRFFEPRRATCPGCDGGPLSVELSCPDRFQHKPGRFTLDRCEACGRVFQNPRLTPDGLSFYYRDFYDGLGGAWLDTLFGTSLDAYLARAGEATQSPRRWLDVGGGYGHFCLMAKTLWPDTRFECLDVGPAVEEGQRRGWFDAAHRGYFPALAPTLAGAFDVVSLSHCLEHTPDPRAELQAAHRALGPGGTLIIEVPDPTSSVRKLLGSYWMPYLQPQHLNLLPVEQLERLLGESGFEVLRVRRAEAHTGVDFVGATLLLLDGLAPAPAPCRAERGDPGLRRFAVWGLGLPFLIFALGVDALQGALLRFVPGLSNAYRVVARAR